MSLKYALLSGVPFAVFLACTSVAHAQFNFLIGLPNEAQDLSITLSPQYPGPSQSVQLSVQSSYIDLTQSSVTWYVNGSEISEGEGVTTASVTTGGIGSQTNVAVDVQAQDGTVASTNLTIVPTGIDLLFDANSYVPPFYQGRALPSPGTEIRLQAIPHFEESGTALSAGALTYTWKQDGRTIASASGKGRSTAILPTPTFAESTTITVDAVSSDGNVSGEGSVTVPIGNPVLELYEDDPLFGVLYHQALSAQTSIAQTEMTFQATPYFADVESPNDPRLAWVWTVNQNAVAPNKADPSEVTINAANSTGVANIAATVTESGNLFMDSGGQWDVNLAGGSANGSGVFQSAGSAQPASPFTQ